jgi:hypothetical protein
MPDASTQPSPRIAAVPPVDPLARLHHMSTTAGVTTQEYVAINAASVVTVVLGMLSLAVLQFEQPILVVIPVAAIVFGLVSLKQIRNSNGTQWGSPLAWAGIVLAVLLGGGTQAKGFVKGRAQASDEQQVAQLIAGLGELVAKNDDAKAYAMFTDRFRERVPLEAFSAKWELVRKNVGPVRAIKWNGVSMRFETDGSGTMYGLAMAKVDFITDRPTDGRQQFNVRKAPEGWQIDAIPLLFSEDKKKAPAGAAVPSGAAPSNPASR